MHCVLPPADGGPGGVRRPGPLPADRERPALSRVRNAAGGGLRRGPGCSPGACAASFHPPSKINSTGAEVYVGFINEIAALSSRKSGKPGFGM
jgi:hypothetical protein